jgi:thiol-disulfide isomerase/thioredoxin
MKYILMLLLSISLFSCKNKDEILIEGRVSDIPTNTLYLVEVGNHEVIIDSATYKDGKFVFRLNNKTEPLAAQIMYLDANKKPIMLMFKNYVKGKGGIAAFWLDYGTTTISGAWRANATFYNVPRLDISTGKNNEYYYKYIGTSFGENFGSIKKEVEKEPNSYFLLSTVLANVENYSPKELNELINLFPANLQKSKLGKRVTLYIENRHEEGTPFKNFPMTSADGVKTETIHKNKLNMIIFWASWCFPCRKEIPQLKEFYSRNNHKDFNQVSVSIDKTPIEWKNALKLEQMDWEQYIVDYDDLRKVQAIYNFQAIPFVVFTDKNGMEIKRFEGYDEKHISEYQKLMDSYFK